MILQYYYSTSNGSGGSTNIIVYACLYYSAGVTALTISVLYITDSEGQSRYLKIFLMFHTLPGPLEILEYTYAGLERVLYAVSVKNDPLYTLFTLS